MTLHVSSDDVRSWVAVEGTAELTPVAADPHDATVEELVADYRGISGEHEDRDDHRRAMVADHRPAVRFAPEHAYGQVRQGPARPARAGPSRVSPPRAPA